MTNSPDELSAFPPQAKPLTNLISPPLQLWKKVFLTRRVVYSLAVYGCISTFLVGGTKPVFVIRGKTLEKKMLAKKRKCNEVTDKRCCLLLTSNFRIKFAFKIESF